MSTERSTHADSADRSTATWPAWLTPGAKVWWGYRQATIDDVRDGGAVVVKLTRRAGFARYGFTRAEVNQLLARELLREYVRPSRRSLET